MHRHGSQTAPRSNRTHHHQVSKHVQRGTTPPRHGSTGSAHSTVAQGQKSKSRPRDEGEGEASHHSKAKSKMTERPLEERVDRLKAELEGKLKALEKLSETKDHVEWLTKEKDPLALCVRQEQMSSNLKIPKMKYSGKSDPKDHVTQYNNIMNLHGASDALKCRIFVYTLEGIAYSWYYKLQPASITNFAKLSMAFMSHFSRQRKKARTVSSLMVIRQGPNEMLRSYIEKFQSATVEIDELTVDFAVEAFMTGLRNPSSPGRIDRK